MPKQLALYLCVKCDASFQPGEPIRFCSKCGSPVKLVGGATVKQILLIDDSKLARVKMTALLKSLGAKVHEAEDVIVQMERDFSIV